MTKQEYREKNWDDQYDPYSLARASIDGMRDTEILSVIECNLCRTAALVYRLTGKGRDSLGDETYGHEKDDWEDVFNALPEDMRAEMGRDYLRFLLDDGKFYGDPDGFMEEVLGAS